MFRQVKTFAVQYERRLSAAAFAIGFIFDNLTLQRVDRLYDNIVMLVYLVAALCSILLLNAHRASGEEGEPHLPAATRAVAQFILPLALGGLFSGFLVFYSRSGSLLASAPFLLSLSALFVGNELFKKHYERFAFQMCVFFVALFSYFSLVVPVLLRQMGDGIFILSGGISLLAFFGVLRVVRFVAPEEVEANRRILAPLIVMLFIFFNFLYFNNMIPPIPLSLKEAGIYHTALRTRGGQYLLSFEAPRWYEFGRTTSGAVHLPAGESIFALSSVYAPAALNTDIVHRWEYLSSAEGEWITASIVRFPISGGRLEGFRGYSEKKGVASGEWRVSVETARGQIIGRLSFEVIPASEPPLLLQVAE